MGLVRLPCFFNRVQRIYRKVFNDFVKVILNKWIWVITLMSKTWKQAPDLVVWSVFWSVF
jgi:hypothetical protein